MNVLDSAQIDAAWEQTKHMQEQEGVEQEDAMGASDSEEEEGEAEGDGAPVTLALWSRMLCSVQAALKALGSGMNPQTLL
jgi:hypothetical protein